MATASISGPTNATGPHQTTIEEHERRSTEPTARSTGVA
jgi:hypothetical protein